MDQQQCSRGSAVDETPREQGSDGNQIEVLAQLLVTAADRKEGD